jgi:hypothetical protein
MMHDENTKRAWPEAAGAADQGLEAAGVANLLDDLVDRVVAARAPRGGSASRAARCQPLLAAAT